MDYNKIYKDIIDNRLSNKYEGYTEIHHIIPRCLGGTDNKDNLVDLSAREHFICHLLLTKMYSRYTNEYYKMCHAFIIMKSTRDGKHKYINSKLYARLKNDFSIRMSELQSGDTNSQYNTKWIYNIELKICKKVPKHYILTNGWYDGRVLDFSFTNKKCLMCNLSLNLVKKSKKKYCNKCKKIKRTYITYVGKKCSIDNVVYNSVAEAAKILMIKPNSLQFRINSKKFINYYYI